MSGQREGVLGLSHVRVTRSDVPTRFIRDEADGFGERLVMFDEAGAPAWEALRLREEFAASPDVTVALEQRLRQLADLSHPALPANRLLDDPERAGGLLLVSPYIRGRRLSKLDRPRSAAFALTVIRDAVAPLAALQRHGEAIAHGSLNLQRILVTTDGRIVLRDHVLGAVLDVLELPASRLWSELGVLGAGSTPVSRRQQDVVHLALVGLSCLVGRPIGAEDYPSRLGTLIEQHVLLPALRDWLHDALAGAFPMASAAEDALLQAFPGSLPGEVEVRASMAVFGRKGDPVTSPLPDAPGLRHLLRDESGSAFVAGRGGGAP